MMSTPPISGFKPYGGSIPSQKKKAVFMLCEEYESLRLHDYKKYTQEEAALIMQISRPTFTRIYMVAREKVAMAFVEGRPISIEGGKVQYDKEWYFCDGCQSLFNLVEGVARICPLCGNDKVNEYSEEDINIEL